MAATGAVPGFLPSEHGLHFRNSYASAPALHFPLGRAGSLPIGNAADGLCGGMCLLVAERFAAGKPVPPDRVAPGPDSPLFEAIVRRQAISLDWLRVPLRFYSLQALRAEPKGPFSRLIGRRTRTEETVREWHRIRAEIDEGRLAPIGLIRSVGANPLRLTRNHQVLAYGYEVTGDRLSLRIYDPNHPDRDDVELRLRLGVGGRGRATMLQTTGEPLFAFFLQG
jgi:hypothetical protein